MSGGVWVVGAAIASPILSFAGASWGSRVTSRADNRLDKWRRREETMRTIRCAAGECTEADSLSFEIGFATLLGLASSELLQPEDELLLELVTDAVLTAERLEEIIPGDDTVVRDEGGAV